MRHTVHHRALLEPDLPSDCSLETDWLPSRALMTDRPFIRCVIDIIIMIRSCTFSETCYFFFQCHCCPLGSCEATRTAMEVPPSVHQTVLVWSARVHLCENEDDLPLQHSARFQETAVGTRASPSIIIYQQHGSSHGNSMAPVFAPADRCDAGNFQPFLITFTLIRGAAPSAHILITAVALQAKHGEPVHSPAHSL
jgi:hypothetical protein